MDIVTQSQVRRPGGRSASVQAAVYRATADLVGERGHEHVTIPLVAARAGVNPTSIYRRWGDVQSLLTAVAVNVLTAESEAPNTGSLRGDLAAWGRGLVLRLKDPEGLALVRAVITAAGGDGPLRCLRGDQIEVMLRRARERGEDAPSFAKVIDLLMAPLYFRALYNLVSPEQDYVDVLIARLFGDGAGGA